jgi:hypothetical protein
MYMAVSLAFSRALLTRTEARAPRTTRDSSSVAFRDASTVPVADRSPDSHSAIESTGFRSLDEGQRLEFDTEPARETQVDDVRAI